MTPVTHRTVRTNGIDMHIAEAGDDNGPLVVLAHGFPELWYSWRHQLPVLAAAGYHVVAPDQRGYGGTSQPAEIEAYDIVHLTDDLLGLVDSLGHDRAAFVGHDWGANVVWAMPLLAPERVNGVAGLSVPFVPRGSRPPTETMKYLFSDTWFYMLYFQAPGVADADLGRDPATTMRRVLGTNFGRAGRGDLGEMLGPRDGKGFVDRLPEPDGLPDWLTPADLDHFVAEFTRTGFTGGLNWYRNLDRNWELMAAVADAKVEVPALFIAGRDDPVLMMMPPAVMEGSVSELRDTVIIDGAGHWVQQERPDEVNTALIEFLDGLR